MLPRFEIVRRLRPVDLVAPRDVRVRRAGAGCEPMPAVAPYLAVVSELAGSGEVALHLGGLRLAAAYDGERVGLLVDSAPHHSRRFGRAESPSELGLTLTGTHLTAWARERDRWVARARYDLRDDLDTREERGLAELVVETTTDEPTFAGGFGQLGLRDTRIVTHANGTPVRDGAAMWFTATSAGPGFFDTAHTSVWRVEGLEIEHVSDLFFRRPDREGVYGDHATHLVRHDDRWLVATSTWGDFEEPKGRAARRAQSTLRVTLASSEADLLNGTHVLDTAELPLPTDGLDSIATWDPHLLLRDERWLVGFVSAKRFFSFHPALAGGSSLDALELRGAVPDRRSTEGTTLLDVDGRLVVLASDGRQGRRGHRARFPAFEMSSAGLSELGALDAPYPTNLPWPTLARDGDGWVMLCFNGAPRGGRLLGYGTHGDLVVMRGDTGVPLRKSHPRSK